MALTLSERSKALAANTVIEKNLIVEIDGIDEIFGVSAVTRTPRFDDQGLYFDKPGLKFDGVIPYAGSREYINHKKTQQSISQQLKIDEGGSGSIQKFKICLVDKNGELSEIFAPGARVDDMLMQPCRVYQAFVGGSHPRDSLKLFNGVIENCDFSQGSCYIHIAHPETLKDRDLFVPVSTTLLTAIDSIDTTIELESAFGMLLPSDGFRTLISLNDEVIEYTGISGNNLTGCTRGIYGTIKASHEVEDDVNSMYDLSGDAIELALRLMFSNPDDEYFIEDVDLKNIRQIDSLSELNNALFFSETDIQDRLGLVYGDFVTLYDSTKTENNFTQRLITGFGSNDLGSWVVVGGTPLTKEIDTDALVKFKSQYNVLPDGCKMSGLEVDIEEHLNLKKLYSSSIPTYNFRGIDEEFNAQEFINTQLYRPAGIYQVPRKAKVSCAMTRPSTNGLETKKLDKSNILNFDKLNIKRSTKSNFYNTVIYKYNQDPISKKYKTQQYDIDGDSYTKIKTGVKSMVIESDGLLKGASSKALIESQMARFLDRYSKAAESLEVECNYKTSITIEITDTVIFDPSGLELTDIKSGTRDFSPRLMEVINKSYSIKTGRSKLTLLDTSFSADGRYGTFAPSSKIESLIDTTHVKVIGFDGESGDTQKDKWQNYLGETVAIYEYRDDGSSDYQEVKLVGFDLANPQVFEFTPALTFTPTAKHVLSCPVYNESIKKMIFWKLAHPFFNPSDTVTSASDSTHITPSDISLYKTEAIVLIHNEDHSQSFETSIKEINGSVLTLNDDIGFVPDDTFLINLIGFKDGGMPYRLIS